MPLQCPACEDRISRADYHGVAVGACDSCKGSWLTGSGFASITQMDGAGFSPRDVAKLKILLEYKVNKSIKHTDHPCPRCKKKLKARNYANIAGFFLEQCPAGCGVWVREGDLDRIRILHSLGRFEEVRVGKQKKARKPAPTAPRPPKKKAAPPRKAEPRKKRAKKREPDAVAEEPEEKKGFLARLLARLFGKKG